jgi:uncharacterized membrane protein
MITLEWVYVVAGLLTAAVAVLSFGDRSNPRRRRTSLFWSLLALSFLAGSHLGDFGNGLLVLAIAATAALGLGQGRPRTTDRAARQASALRWKETLFVVALIIPAVAMAGALGVKAPGIDWKAVLDVKQATVISLTAGAVVALAVGVAVLRPPVLAPLQEARRLMDAVGWAAVLPQALAALGAVFALAGVGKVIGHLTAQAIPVDSRLAVVVAYCLGMALFTVVMGNAFAAFPVMTAGVGLPLIVGKFGGDPAVMAALGMLSGFCGTLVTPMAANFNIVPAALLELPDRYAVIKAQAPTAAVMLLANIALMYGLVFRPWS